MNEHELKLALGILSGRLKLSIPSAIRLLGIKREAITAEDILIEAEEIILRALIQNGMVNR
jgi:hypothetical protein